MKPPEDLTRIIDEKRYSTKTATLLCGDDYWDGRSWERHGRNTWLYRTPKGKYFQVYFIECQGEQSEIITPRSLDELDNHRIVLLGGQTVPTYLQNRNWLT